MIKTLNRFGKTISCSVEPFQTSWMLVKDGPDSWLYTTNPQMDTTGFNTYPIYVNKKGMWDLLVHFHCDTNAITDIFKRDGNV